MLKMKNIKFYIVSALVFLVMSCDEDFLIQKDLFTQLDENYYSSPDEIDAALAAVYAAIPTDAGNNNPTLLSELMSDDRFGGGGTNDIGFKDTDAFTISTEDYYRPVWRTYYEGIFRANMILKRFDQANYTDENAKNQALGETYFLRAYLYLKLCQLFGTVPLITDPAPVNFPKASPEELFGQIAFDLKKAIELMPAIPYNPSGDQSRLGHATKWAAEGMMARAFLFYTGYYQKSELPLVEGGGSVTKNQVITWVDECIASSGHGLVRDFRNLWLYSAADTTSDYPYNNILGGLDNKTAKWVGESGGNIETVFAIKYSLFGGWNAPNKLSYSNQLSLYMGLRGANNNWVPFGQGWGGGPVNPQLWDSFEEGDIRKEGSILNVNNPNEGAIYGNYVWNGDNSQHETGMYGKKYLPIIYNSNNSIRSIYSKFYPGTSTDMQIFNMQDEVLLRFADILLMGAELGSANAQDYFDQVRERAGLTSKPVTLENIKIERRHELCMEGIRYFDLLRWRDAEAAFAIASNIPVKTTNLDEMYVSSFRPETGGFLPIPESQVRLSNGLLLQNPGWE